MMIKRLFYKLICVTLFANMGCSEHTSDANNTDERTEKHANTKFTIIARGITRHAGVPFSITDPFNNHKTNKIPLYKTDIKLYLSEDGSVTGNRVRVQYGWSPQGFIADSVVFFDDLNGHWSEKERLLNDKEPVFQIDIDNLGYQWYLPANGQKIYAYSGDNWEAMINNDTQKSYSVLSFTAK